ncbi:hypothetical protein BKA56DRAFT_310645 [Ilyonectria sp. MPI-CAGE-AT-0026]|nr:hypothetical protein BKA56DRAFT_310645 [Ilyonectria sp. MPI-CAGE-AT-0026]
MEMSLFRVPKNHSDTMAILQWRRIFFKGHSLRIKLLQADKTQNSAATQWPRYQIHHEDIGKRRCDQEAHAIRVPFPESQANTSDTKQLRNTPTLERTEYYSPIEIQGPNLAHDSNNLFLDGIRSWLDNCSGSHHTVGANLGLDVTSCPQKQIDPELWQLARVRSEVKSSRPKKRSRQPSPLEIDPSIESPQSLGTMPLLWGGKESKPLASFACPFYKEDRHKYHDCLKYELRRVKDVKQHIYRKHMKPEFYCPRCFQKFSTAEFRDVHTVEPQCKREVNPQFDGISSHQRKSLNNYTSRGRSLKEQWFDTWDIIFPTQRRPSSCYLGNYVEEITSQLRDFWHQRKSEILKTMLDDKHFDAIDPSLLDRVLGTFFNRFESEMSSTAIEINTPPQSIPHSPQQHFKTVDKRVDGFGQEFEHMVEKSEQVEPFLVDAPSIPDLDGWLNESDGEAKNGC